jgi:hypothetical protein
MFPVRYELNLHAFRSNSLFKFYSHYDESKGPGKIGRSKRDFTDVKQRILKK